MLNDCLIVDESKLFMICDTSQTENDGAELKFKQENSDCMKFFFINFDIQEWNKLPHSEVQCYATDSFNNKLGDHFPRLSTD